MRGQTLESVGIALAAGTFLDLIVRAHLFPLLARGLRRTCGVGVQELASVRVCRARGARLVFGLQFICDG